MSMEQSKRPRDEQEGDGADEEGLLNPPKRSKHLASSPGDQDVIPDPPQRRGPKAVRRVRKGFHTITNISSAVKLVIDRSKEYKHKPLSPGSDQIRLLKLHAGKSGDTIHCSFLNVSLADVPRNIRYEALSYYWGTDEPSHEIWIRDVGVLKDDVRELKGIQKLRIVAAATKPEKFHVRDNLHAALEHFRDESRDIFLWIDALCIDQQQEEEKTQQVSKMSRIYSKASHVLIWLGGGDKASDDPEIRDQARNCEQAFDFIDEVVNLAAFDKLATDERSAPQWNALVELMHCHWFSRRWVVQELALASDATLHYNDKIIHWKDFSDAVAVFAARFDDIKRLSRSSGRLKDFVHDVEGLGANDLVDVTNNLFHKSLNLKGFKRKEENVPTRLLSLEALVAKLLKFEASDPRDTVYALLSIARPEAHPSQTSVPRKLSDPVQVLKPDYTKTMVEVYRDFVAYCVATSGSIDIICRHWAPIGRKPTASFTPLPLKKILKKKPKIQDMMPSWVALLTKAAFGDPEDALNGRVNGNSLVGQPDEKFYNACAGRNANVSFETTLFRPADLPDTEAGRKPPLWIGGSNPSSPTDPTFPPEEVNAYFMLAEGFQVDVIQEVSARIADGLLLRECLVMGGWEEPYPLENREVPDALWKTLVAGKDPKGKNPPSWYHRACLHCLAASTTVGDINTSTLIKDPSTPSLAVKFLKRVQSIVWERVFLMSKGTETSGRKLFGLAPNEAHAGDIICILYGCSVPVILRDIRNPLTNEHLYYRLVGESYIYGLMDGEASFDDFFPAEGTKTFKLG